MLGFWDEDQREFAAGTDCMLAGWLVAAIDADAALEEMWNQDPSHDAWDTPEEMIGSWYRLRRYAYEQREARNWELACGAVWS